jgi:hypothetical protein
MARAAEPQGCVTCPIIDDRACWGAKRFLLRVFEAMRPHRFRSSNTMFPMGNLRKPSIDSAP